jgi:hypothetical protein
MNPSVGEIKNGKTRSAGGINSVGKGKAFSRFCYSTQRGRSAQPGAFETDCESVPIGDR